MTETSKLGAELERTRAELKDNQLTIQLMAEINEKTASLLASVLGKRSANAIERGRLLLIPNSGPIRTICRKSKSKPKREPVSDEDLGKLLRAWSTAFGSKPTAVRDALAFAYQTSFGELIDALKKLGDTPRSIGNSLARATYWVGGLAFGLAATRQRSEPRMWKVLVADAVRREVEDKDASLPY